MFKLSVLSLLLILISTILSICVTSVTEQICEYYLGLPVFSLPFVIVNSILYLASARFPNLIVNELYFHQVHEFMSLSPILDGFFNSLSTLLFIPSNILGFAIAILILLYSRILFILAFLGYVVGGTINGLLIGNISSIWLDISAFNYILIAMYLGGIFIVPSRLSIVLALGGVAAATLLVGAFNTPWSKLGIPLFTMPFIVITLSTIYLIKKTQHPKLWFIRKSTPEETVEYSLTSKIRATEPQLPIGAGEPLSFHDWIPTVGTVLQFEENIPSGARQIEIKVNQTADGWQYFERGSVKLYFGVDYDWLCMYHMVGGWDPYLATLYLSWPKMQLLSPIGRSWKDTLYSAAVQSPMPRMLIRNLSWLLPTTMKVSGFYQLTSEFKIVGRVTVPMTTTPIETQFERNADKIIRIQAGSIILTSKDK